MHTGLEGIMNNRYLGLVFILLVMSIGCTNKQIYEATQPKFNEAQCMKLPQSQYDECMQRETQSYEDYERERNESPSQ
jgi:hypothetical protein